MARQSSTSSQLSHSPSETSQQKAKAPRKHVVGGSRMQRNHSFGTNLNKLNKQAQAQTQAPGGDGNPQKHHRRALSGNSTSAPSSPRPGIKRNASAGAVLRVGKHGHANIRKNLSSGHLSREGGSKPALKSSKSEIAPPKRSLINPARTREPSPDEHPTVHFDVAEEEAQDDGWTEESASQSPTTTRSNTRSNSVVLDSHRPTDDRMGGMVRAEPGEHHLPGASGISGRALPDRTLSRHQSNGSSSHHHTHSRPADADMITSRLLQRSSQHHVAPQMSNVAATVVSNQHEPRELSQSAGSILADTPGRELVSRFIDGDGSAGTPNSSFLPSRNGAQASSSSTGNLKRNKSMPNVADEETPPTRTPRRSGTSTPTDLPPSRTQQKLMLQRASSAIEPQKLIPSILPRTGGPTALYSGMTYTTNGEGRLDPRLQQQFNHVSVEYNVVRRYRNPLVEAIVRIEQIPGSPRRTRASRASSTNGFVNVHGSSSLSTSYHDETEGSASRRSRVSFENGRNSRDEGDVEGRQSFESDNGRIRNEAEELCRRLWESQEVVEHD